MGCCNSAEKAFAVLWNDSLTEIFVILLSYNVVHRCDITYIKFKLKHIQLEIGSWFSGLCDQSGGF